MTSDRRIDDVLTPAQRVENLVHRYRHVAVLVAHDMLGDWTLAEDAAQLAFVAILERLRAGDRDLLDGGAEAAVRRNARWAAMKVRRGLLRRADAEQRYGESMAALGPDHHGLTEARLTCETVLRPLPEHYRQAIGLRFFRDVSDGDAAASLDVTLRAYRRRLDRAVEAARRSAQALGLRGSAAVLFTLGDLRGVLRRARQAAAHLGGELTAAWSTPVVNATALLVLGSGVAAPALATASSPPGPAASSAPPPWLRAGSAVSVPGSTAAVATATRPAAAATASSAPRPAPRRPRTAWDETPEDSTIYSAAAAPGQDGEGRVVALGLGHGCFCLVLFESPDAGHTWAAVPGPQVNLNLGNPQVTLPPAYPADPRIFVSSAWSAAAVDLVADRFGAAFHPLPVSGYLTLPPSFEQDGTMLATQAAGVVLVRLQAAVAEPLVFMPPLTGSPTVVAAPAGADDVYVAADDLATTGDGTAPVLYRCAGTLCSQVSRPDLAAVQYVALSTHFATDRTLALAWNHQVLLSRDAGATFTPLPDHPDAIVANIQVSGDARGPVVWATVIDAGTGGTGVSRWDATSGWVPVIPMRNQALWGLQVHPLVLDGNHVVVQTGNSLLCTADAGRSWAARCA